MRKRRTQVFLPLAGPLHEARFLGRPNRFIVHARLQDGREAVAHLADPGRLVELLVPGRRVWLRHTAAPHRKTQWSALVVESPDSSGLVSVDTGLPNRLVGRALEEGAIDELSGWRLEKREHTVGHSRFDFLLRRRRGGPGPRQMALEVKSVTLVEGRVGFFPDAVTTRGTRHVRELTDLQRSGDWATTVLFVLQRPDADRIMPDAAIDPEFARALAEARRAGVRVLGRRCTVDLERITLGSAVPVRFPASLHRRTMI